MAQRWQQDLALYFKKTLPHSLFAVGPKTCFFMSGWSPWTTKDFRGGPCIWEPVLVFLMYLRQECDLSTRATEIKGARVATTSCRCVSQGCNKFVCQCHTCCSDKFDAAAFNSSLPTVNHISLHTVEINQKEKVWCPGVFLCLVTSRGGNASYISSSEVCDSNTWSTGSVSTARVSPYLVTDVLTFLS